MSGDDNGAHRPLLLSPVGNIDGSGAPARGFGDGAQLRLLDRGGARAVRGGGRGAQVPS